MASLGEGIRVLLVDDDLAFAQCIKELLMVEEFQVTTYATAAGAIHSFERGTFDVVVTDLVLTPGDAPGSGLDLLRQIRVQKPSFPAVVLTGFASLSKHQLLEANVPVVEKTPAVLDVLPGVIVDAIERSRATGYRLRRTDDAPTPTVPQLDEIRRSLATEISQLTKLKESTIFVPTEGPIELAKAIQGFKKDMEKRLMRFPYHQNVFLMMKFRDSNRDVGIFICETLEANGLRGIRADAPEWNITRNIYNPIAVLHCSKYGIALFYRGESKQAFSPNVAYELGMLHQQNKECLVLKHTSLPPMPFDLIKDLYIPYDENLQLKGIISRWIQEISFDAGSAEPRVAPA